MSSFPSLVPQEIQLEGRGLEEAAADLTLSSLGWVAVTAASGQRVALRLHGPQGAPYDVRMPPLLPRVVQLRGERVAKSPRYKTVRPTALLGGGALGVMDGAVQLRLEKKKKKKKTRKKEKQNNKAERS